MVSFCLLVYRQKQLFYSLLVKVSVISKKQKQPIENLQAAFII
ncbi:hypothetical protein M23134_03230 [Microscilla marina ATCC 23134]|uniref:Uncharacterized protein n=1 Tax=Microscilla marina ATCC 23134 TaxID=313606 RepID=A1ZGH5_MICM2|nr:hypothetical protein M23134_03230 [Microscilla marina ATCC 23134]